MYKQNQRNQPLQKSFQLGEDSIFVEEKQEMPIAVEQPKKEPLPRIKWTKRIETKRSTYFFYGIWFLMITIAFVLQFNQISFRLIISYLLSALSILYCFRFTNPSFWKREERGLLFWNWSVTTSVWIKSLHLRIYEWRTVLMWSIATSILLLGWIDIAFIGLGTGLYAFIGFCFLAERNLTMYTQLAYILAWGLIVFVTLQIIQSTGISIGLVLSAMLLYQLYERLSELEIEQPFIDQ